MLEDKTNITSVGKIKYIRIPHTLSIDSAFPFSDDEKLKISIKDKKIITQKDELSP